MAVHDNREFEQLFAAFTNADVTGDERARLHELAGQDVGRRGAIAEVEAIHELLAVEASMRDEIMRPVEPAEEADESFRRMAKAAARAGEKMRAQMLHPTNIRTFEHPSRGTAPARSRVWLYSAAVAAVLMIAVAVGMLMNQSTAPGLSTGLSPDSVLGAGAEIGTGAEIDVTTSITEDSPELIWSEVKGAASYEVSILDADNVVVLRRAEGRRFIQWKLNSDMTMLRAHEGDLFVTVVARNRAGEIVGATKRPRPLEVE
jgi:hypothetical protein